MTISTITENDSSISQLQQQKSDSLWALAWRRLRRDRLTMLAITVVLLLSVLAIFAPTISDIFDVSYTEPDTSINFLPIGSPGHPLGTDHLGRDVLARMLYGGRVSLAIGFSAAIFCTIIGVTVGLVAGYYQGGALRVVDDGIMWFITTLNSIPTLMLLILISAVASPTIPTLIFVLTLVSWTSTMRLIRGETLIQRENEYVMSARALGAGPFRILFRHILPNTLSILITSLAIQIGTIILIESALSFLGLGVRPPEPSWGNMLTSAQSYFRQGPHLSILPGLLIMLTVLCLYLAGDGLRDAFDPKNTK